MCRCKDSIQFNRGGLTECDGIQYVFEPMIRPFYKYTSSTGWIWKDHKKRVAVACVEAFVHYTYHKSNRKMIVTDLQGIYGLNHYNFGRSRYILSEPAVCSKKRLYGPSDKGQEGIEKFFANHVCNGFCIRYGRGKWKCPQTSVCSFESATSNSTEEGPTKMMPSSETQLVIHAGSNHV